jgi:hypothetical protein
MELFMDRQFGQDGVPIDDETYVETSPTDIRRDEVHAALISPELLRRNYASRRPGPEC